MAEVEWTEGRGLEDGLPDSGWSTRKLLTVYPTEKGWRVQVCGGPTWGHLEFGESASFKAALKEACSQAIENGCPEEWLPINDFRLGPQGTLTYPEE